MKRAKFTLLQRAINTELANLRAWANQLATENRRLARLTPDGAWLEFMVNGLCSLCGNRGVIDSRGVQSFAGVECGGLHYCICPNGRALKAHKIDKEPYA